MTCKKVHKNAQLNQSSFKTIMAGSMVAGCGSANARKHACLPRAGDGGKARAAGWEGVYLKYREIGAILARCCVLCVVCG